MSKPREIPYVAAEAVIALRRAMICAACEAIFDVSLGPSCPTCLDTVVVPLESWLPSVDPRGSGVAWWVGSGR